MPWSGKWTPIHLIGVFSRRLLSCQGINICCLVYLMVIVVESLFELMLLESKSSEEKLGGFVLDFLTIDSPSFTRFIDWLISWEFVELWNLVLVFEWNDGFFLVICWYFFSLFSNMTLLKIFLYSNLTLDVQLNWNQEMIQKIWKESLTKGSDHSW